VQISSGLRLVLRQARGLGRVADGAVDVGAQGDRALRDRVVVVGQAHREGLEQRMQGREVRALDVPVGDLDLAVQVQAVGQPRVERLREAPPCVFLESTRTAIHGDLLHRPPPHAPRPTPAAGTTAAMRTASCKCSPVSPPSTTTFSWAFTQASQALMALTARQKSSKSSLLVAGWAIRCMRSRGGICE